MLKWQSTLRHLLPLNRLISRMQNGESRLCCRLQTVLSFHQYDEEESVVRQLIKLFSIVVDSTFNESDICVVSADDALL